MKIAKLGLTLLLAAAAVPASACYTVYRNRQVVYQSVTSPVDLTGLIGNTVPQRFGSGALMVTSIYSADCREVRSNVAATSAHGTARPGRRTRRGGSASVGGPGDAPNDASVSHLLSEATPIRSEVGVSSSGSSR